jgi:hypothetical protein
MKRDGLYKWTRTTTDLQGCEFQYTVYQTVYTTAQNGKIIRYDNREYLAFNFSCRSLQELKIKVNQL